MGKTALSKAVDLAGGQNSLANKIGVRQSVLWFWLNKSKKGVPAEYCAAIAGATGVPAHELRPDVFPDPSKEGQAA
jgi:DNA-binding transcriptional regulator YdaS (Cro superfamily)